MLKSYISQVLGAQEVLVHRARVTLWGFLGSFAWLGVCLFGSMVFYSINGMQNLGSFFLIVAALTAVQVAVRYYGTELGITNHRVIAKTGIIRRDTVEINLDKIESIHIAQSIAGRLLNYGTIIVYGAGTTHAPIRGIAAPLEFRRKYDEAYAGRLTAQPARV